MTNQDRRHPQPPASSGPSPLLDTHERSLLNCFSLLAPPGRGTIPLCITTILENAENLTGIATQSVNSLVCALESKGFIAPDACPALAGQQKFRLTATGLRELGF